MKLKPILIVLALAAVVFFVFKKKTPVGGILVTAPGTVAAVDNKTGTIATATIDPLNASLDGFSNFAQMVIPNLI